LDSPPGLAMETMTLRRYLAEIALRGGMEFFAQPDDLSQPSRCAPLMAPQRTSEPTDLSVASLAHAIGREGAFPRWGINE
jgi:hypothetical protein